jgi:outer membrane lipopolysaccharide assembly protein LptE/RlpB
VIYRVVEPSGQVLVSNSQLSFSRDLIYQSTQLLQKKEEEKAEIKLES